MILRGQLRGKVGRRRDKIYERPLGKLEGLFFFQSCTRGRRDELPANVAAAYIRIEKGVQSSEHGAMNDADLRISKLVCRTRQGRKRNAEQRMERKAPRRCADSAKAGIGKQVIQLADAVVSAVADCPVEIVHGARRHGDDEAPAGAKDFASHPKSAFRRGEMLENLAADDGVCASLKNSNVAISIEINSHKPGGWETARCHCQCPWLHINSDQTDVWKGVPDPLQECATPAAEVNHNRSLWQALQLTHYQSPAVPLCWTELVREREAAPKFLVLLGVAHSRLSPRRARI